MRFLWIMILIWLGITLLFHGTRHKLLVLSLGLLALTAALAAAFTEFSLFDLTGRWLS